ncbi:MAG: glutamate racemase [Calditrichia bacterium]
MDTKSEYQYDNRAIGVFDSGVGGLTVVKQLMRRFPNENIVYFGDTARIPYGSKSEETVTRFALENSAFLLEHDVKMVVVACNTASAISIDFLKKVLPVPVIGVLQPGAAAAVQYTQNQRIGVIGTAATIRSGSYRREILKRKPEVQVVSQACPLFVPLVEEGWIEDEATYLIARRYLQPLLENSVDSIILGCTHYPLLKPVLAKIVGKSVKLVDSGVETAAEVEKLLLEEGLMADPLQEGRHQFFLSDMPYKFQDIAERFLERTIPHVQTVNFEDFVLQKGKRFWKKYHGMMKNIY